MTMTITFSRQNDAGLLAITTVVRKSRTRSRARLPLVLKSKAL